LGPGAFIHELTPLDERFPNSLIAYEVLFFGVVPVSFVIDYCPPDVGFKIGSGTREDEDGFYIIH
jgi:hypothetical protein